MKTVSQIQVFLASHQVVRAVATGTFSALVFAAGLTVSGLDAQSQGTYLLVDFSEGEGAGALDSLTVARLGPVDGAVVAEDSYFDEMPGTDDGEADQSAAGESREAEATSNFTQRKSAFSESPFSLPADQEQDEEVKLFDEDAFLKPGIEDQLLPEL